MDLAPVFAAGLLLARILPVVELTPVLSGPWVPRTVRIAVAMGLAALLAPFALPPALLVQTPGWLDAGVLVGRELLIGIAIGFVASLVFEGARMAGGIVDRVAGWSRTAQEGPIARLYVLVSAALFFVLGGPELWLAALGRSYVVVALDAPVGAADGLLLARAVADMIAVAVLLALPVLGTVLVAELLHAIAARMSRVLDAGVPPASTRTLVIVAAIALSVGVFTDELGGVMLETMGGWSDAMEVLHVR